jgi:protein O-GlcNAc transferase
MLQHGNQRAARTDLDEGNEYLAANNFPSAIMAYQRALQSNPRSVEAFYNCGVAFHQQGHLDQAIACYNRAIGLLPGMAEAHFNLAHALSEVNRPEEAEAAYRTTMRLQPQNAAAAYNLGLLYKSRGQYPQAMELFNIALRICPNYAEAHNNIGVIWRDQNRLDQARMCFEQALAITPDMVEALYNLGIVLHKQGDFLQAIDMFRRALTLNPYYAPARWLYHLALPIFYAREEDIQASRKRFSANLTRLVTTPLDTLQERLHAYEGVAAFTNFYLQYQGLDDLELQKEYGAFVTRVMGASFPQWSADRPMPAIAHGERIRVGYLSSCVYGHTIGIFLLGWMEKHDREQFEIFCYHVGDRTDALTEAVGSVSDHFFHFPGQVTAAATQIASDRLHILVHTDIGMNPVTLQLAALRLAPVQCKGWGHPVTTGLPTIDYYLSSDLMETEQSSQYYSETLIRLPNIALNYTPPSLPGSPKSRRHFGLPEDAVVYLSTQSLFKYLPQHDDIYPRILAKVPDAVFVFVANSEKQVTDLFAQRLAKTFSDHRMPVRCLFMPRMNHSDFLSLNMAADVLLDTLEWSGGKTSLEAIACNLPVVTLPGRFMRGRHTYAFLTRMGLAQTIAADKEAYIRLAVRAGTDPAFHAQVKNHIGDHKRVLFHDTSVIDALEVFYKQVCRPDAPIKGAISP